MVGTLGKTIRMNRLFSSKSGRMVSIMLDHTIARGLLPGLINIQSTIDKIVQGMPDAMSMQKGIADACFEQYGGKNNISLILKASSPSPYEKDYAAILADVEEAIKHGADAIAVGCILGGKKQAIGMEHAAQVTKAASEWGMPVVGHFYPNGEAIPADQREYWENVAYAARAGAEIGIDVMKIHHSGKASEMEKIIEAVPARIVLAGGMQGNKIRNYLQNAKNFVGAGGAGVAFGRVAWSFEDPAAFVKAVKLIVHENGTVDQSIEYLEDCVKKKLE